MSRQVTSIYKTYKPGIIRIAACVLFYLSFCGICAAQTLSISSQECEYIGGRVFANECSSKDDNLEVWNQDEEFLSLGIGHFIWYPKNTKKIYNESFTRFLDYAAANGIKIPDWIDAKSGAPCPWNSRDDFLLSLDSPEAKDLKGFLRATKNLQVAFVVERANESLLIMFNALDPEEREKIMRRFVAVSSTPNGRYALVDYINFKGCGISATERYNGKGWGLLQVLSGMEDLKDGDDALKEFVRSAKRVLEERVANSPASRNEKQWLAGWKNRVGSYLKAA